MPSSARAGLAFVAAAAALWGLWPVWTRGATGGAQTATISFVVGLAGALPLALGEARRRPARPRRLWALFLVFGLCDAGNVWLYFRALAEAAVAPAALSHYLAPVLVALAAPLALGEPRSPRTPAALALAVAGTALLLGGGGGLPGSGAAHGVLLGGASAVFYAACVLLGRRLGREFGSAELIAYHSAVSLLVLAPLTGLPPAADWLRPAGGAVVSSFAAGLLFFAGLRRAPAERAAVLTYVEPVAAVLVGWVVFAEVPPPLALAGGVLVLGAGLLVATSGPAASPPRLT